MKTNRLLSGDTRTRNSQPHPRYKAKLRLVLPILGLVALAFSFAKWSFAQSVQKPDPVKQRLGEPDETPAQRADRELARIAIVDPAGFEKVMNKRKSAADIEAEQIAIFGIAQPRAYSAEFEKFKDNDRRQKEKAARDAVLEPVKHSGDVEKLKEDVKKKKDRGEETDEILNPKFVSRNIPTKPAVKPPMKVKD